MNVSDGGKKYIDGIIVDLMKLNKQKMDIKQLREMQSWSLDQKMYHSLEVIDTFYQRLNGKCYVSFSG